MDFTSGLLILAVLLVIAWLYRRMNLGGVYKVGEKQFIILRDITLVDGSKRSLALRLDSDKVSAAHIAFYNSPQEESVLLTKNSGLNTAIRGSPTLMGWKYSDETGLQMDVKCHMYDEGATFKFVFPPGMPAEVLSLLPSELVGTKVADSVVGL